MSFSDGALEEIWGALGPMHLPVEGVMVQCPQYLFCLGLREAGKLGVQEQGGPQPGILQ
jgi:hypothetical protein